jgi:hypothetical protein
MSHTYIKNIYNLTYMYILNDVYDIGPTSLYRCNNIVNCRNLDFDQIKIVADCV